MYILSKPGIFQAWIFSNWLSLAKLVYLVVNSKTNCLIPLDLCSGYETDKSLSILVIVLSVLLPQIFLNSCDHVICCAYGCLDTKLVTST